MDLKKKCNKPFHLSIGKKGFRGRMNKSLSEKTNFYISRLQIIFQIIEWFQGFVKIRLALYLMLLSTIIQNDE